MKFQRSSKGFTLIELLVVISIIAILASLAVPAVTSALVKGQLIQTMNNSRQIFLASFSMANDAIANNDTTLGWPADITGTDGAAAPVTTISDYVKLLVTSGYLRGEDVKKLFSAPGLQTSASGSGNTLSSLTSPAFVMNEISDSFPTNALFLCTKNFEPASPSNFATTETLPYANKGYVICRKGGDVGIYKTGASGAASISGSINLMK